MSKRELPPTALKPDKVVVKPIDAMVVQRAASIQCTMEEIATLCGMSASAFRSRVEKYPQLQQMLEDGRNMGRETLRRMQWQRAENGSDAMLIWLGKQILGQRDKMDAEHTGRNGEPLIPMLNLTINRD